MISVTVNGKASASRRPAMRINFGDGKDQLFGRGPAVSLRERIRERLASTGKSMRTASIDAGLNGDTIGKILKRSDDAPSLATIKKLARGLHTSPEWLAYGLNVHDGVGAPGDRVVVDRKVLSDAVRYVLEKVGCAPEEAAELAQIFPEALAGPAVDVVEGDPFLSFRVHLQLGSSRSSSRSRR